MVINLNEFFSIIGTASSISISHTTIIKLIIKENQYFVHYQGLDEATKSI